jgi:hypothetical protein
VTVVAVPPSRIPRWIDNFAARHGPTELLVADGSLVGSAEDSSTFTASLPFSYSFAGSPSASAFAAACTPPLDWGVLLVRKGGFAVARLSGAILGESKVGQRHVQGRTKAGGQSQQRFARRRDNQARAAYEAAGEHAVRILGDAAALVVGGDHVAVTAVLEDQRLRQVGARVCGEFLTVADPRRGVLEAAIAEASSATMSVSNA